MRTIITAIGLLLGLTDAPLWAQTLRPGFDKSEYIELMRMSAQFGDSTYFRSIPAPQRFRHVYRSPVVGLENRWDLWTDGTNTAVVSLRGTTANSVSWLANLYAAMVPAKGELQLGNGETFTYALAENPKAAVHVGWLVSTAFLSRDILPKLDSSYRRGVRNVFIMGHSQGGAIGFLLTAHLRSLQRQGRLPADVRFKTYCSAGPKPGNLYFAYDYEAQTQGGWAYNVVNSADWVPEVPFTVQTVSDFNTTNPFNNASGLIKKQKFFRRIILRSVYNSLSKPSIRAQKNYQKYLGRIASNTVRKNLNGYVAPQYYNSNDYVRTGATIVLPADSAYYRRYPDSPTNVFVHHFHPPYLYLTEERLDTNGATMTHSANPRLAGTWELNYILYPATPVEQLFPDRKPTLTFDTTGGRVSGSTGCNRFNGPVTVSGSTIRFSENLATTRMACPGNGEGAFLEVLRNVNRYALSDDTLTFIAGDIAVMRFRRK